MKALVGLGNPGPAYALTRHNLGFRVADRMVARHGGGAFRTEPLWLSATLRLGPEELLVVKPQTYMNRSGQAVRALKERHGVAGHDLMVVHDDLDLELGTVRVKRGGGHGGHNGLRSILEEAEAGEFVRIRLGIRRGDPQADAVSWVLAPVPEGDREVVQSMVERAAEAAEVVVRSGASRAMNEFNRRSAVEAERTDAGPPGGPR